MVTAGGAFRREPEYRMFQHLLASRPGSLGRDGAAASSVSVHLTAIAAIAWVSMAGTTREPEAPDTAEHVTFYDLAKPDPEIARKAAADAAAAERQRQAVLALEQQAEAEKEARLLLVLNPPEMMASEIPEAQQVAFITLSEEDLAGIELGVSTMALLNEHIEPSAEQLALQTPDFTQHTDEPELVNIDEVRRELRHEYPVFLQDAGIGGRVLLWFLIDETGGVRKWQLKASSGFRDLDGAALRAAALMRFRPARNYDHSVAVWVVVPILFQPGEAGFAS